MDCPACTNPLHVVRIEDTQYHCCRTCHGIWADTQALEAFLRHIPARTPGRAASNSSARPNRARPCPACGKAMASINYCLDSGIWVDSCPACRSLWLDRGQAQQMAAYRAADTPRMAAARSLCEEIAQSDATYRALDVDSNWVTVIVSRLPLPDPDELLGLPLVALGILLANVVMMAIYTYIDATAVQFFSAFGLNWIRVLQGEALYTLVTYMFIHTSYLHIVTNMLFLLASGPLIENRIGHAKFTALYFMLGFTSTLPFYDQNVLLVGASGAISGLMGFTMAVFPLQRIRVISWLRYKELPAVYVFGGWVVIQLFYAFLFSMADVRSEIAFSAHLAGFFSGLLLGLINRRQQKLAHVH